MLKSFNVLARGKSSSELKLIFKYSFPHLSQFLIIDLIRSLIYLIDLYFFNMSLPSSVGTSVKCLFPFLSLNVTIYFIHNQVKQD